MISVHSHRIDALERDMDIDTTPEALPIAAGDPEPEAGPLETLLVHDCDAVVDQPDDLKESMRRAWRASRMLATLDPALRGVGLQLRVTPEYSS